MAWFDTLKSFVSGLGTAQKDKTLGLSYEMRSISDAELNAMHRCDWLARKIVDIIPNDMTREWRNWQAEAKIIEAIEAVEKAPLVSVQLKVNEAMRKARLLRGSAIYIGLRGAKTEEPVELDKIKAGDLQYLNVLNRSEVSAGEIVRDVTSEFYGQPSYYEMNGATGTTVRIHPSRIVRFVGADILDQQFANDGWGDSILQVVYDAVQNSSSIQQHVASMVPEAKVDVIYIPQLSEFLKNPTTERQLTSRFAYANQIKSNFNMVLLEGNGTDAGEKWEQKELSFTQLPEIMQIFLQVASGAADIPVTRLLGQSPAGMNATGDSDTRNYYDNISSRQRTELGPRLNYLDEIIIRSALGSRPPEVHYTWAPLWGLSETERATNFKTKVDAVRGIAGSGGMNPSLVPLEALSDALVNMLVEDGSLPGIGEAVEKYGSLAKQMEEDDEDDVIASATPPAAEEPEAATTGEEDPPEEDDNVIKLPKRAATGDAEPKTLYVRRDVVNAEEITAWAKSQGLTEIVEDLHVTVVYSQAPLDWIKAGNASDWDGKAEITIPEGGPRVVEPLGNMSAVLLFASSSLCWRHEEIVRAGASHGYPEYVPHISLTKAPVDESLTIEPYRGKIILGPEIFEEIKP